MNATADGGADRRIRVLVVSDMYALPESGSGGFLHLQTRELKKQRVEARVLVPKPRLVRKSRRALDAVALRGPAVAETRVDGVAVRLIPHWNVPVYPLADVAERLVDAALRPVVREIAAVWPFELIHCHRLFPVGPVAVRAARESNVPVVLSARGSDVHTHPHRSGRLREATVRALREADGVTAVSRELALSVKRLAGIDLPVSVVRNGVDLAKFRPGTSRESARCALELPRTGPGLCVIGRLHPIKGVSDVAAAFSRLAAEYRDVWIAFVGDGPLRDELETWRSESGASDRIFLPGRVPHDEIAGWLRASDLLVLGSRNEGLPNVVLEAMACGLPVVATSVGGVPEAVLEGVTGLLVEPGSSDGLARAISSLLADPGRREAMGEAGRRRVELQFSWKASAARLVDLYRRLISDHRPGTVSADA